MPVSKALALGCALVTVPLFLSATPQDPARAAREAQQSIEATLRAELDTLRAELRRQTERAERAERTLETVRRELGEALDLVEQSAQEPRRRNCTPSRALLTYYQWMDERGHDERAGRMLDRALAEVGDDPNRLNGLAWSLMNDDESIGHFDRAALAITERMTAGGRALPHRHLDTVALANFLNGRVEQALALQRDAVRHDKGNDDYRRRLRMYEAALAAVRSATAEPQGGVAIRDEE